MAYCRVCSAALSPGAAFCPSCGTAVEGASTCASCGAAATPGQNFCGSCGAPASPGAAGFSHPAMSPVVATVDESVAGFWWRFLGYLIDSVVLWVAAALPLENSHVSAHVASALSVALSALYFGLFVRFKGATLGMMVCRTRCVSADGAALSSAQVAVRTLTYVVFLLSASLYVVGIYQHPTAAQRTVELREFAVYVLLALPHLVELLWAAWDPRHQTLHDKAAHTLVVRRARA